MLKKIPVLIFLLCFSACASAPVANRGPYKPKSFVTPYEYYSKTRPAVMTSKDQAKVRKVTSQPAGDDTHEDHTQAIIIGTLVGVTVIGGAVAGILLAR
jgi:hypothetical protein